jgi:uncharacterized Zn finger protein
MNTKSSLDKEVIKNYVGLSSFQKGEAYERNRAIKLGKIKNNVITALCQGNEFDPYKVELIFDNQEIKQSYCSCPVGAGGKCKHIAALLLTWVDYPDTFAEWEEIKGHLKEYDSHILLELIDLLEEKVEGSADVIHAFQQNLENLKSPYLAKYLKRIEEAFHVTRLPWYHPDEAAATEVAFALGKIRSDIRQMIENHHFSEVVRIYQSLIQHILSYLDEHQDPWGLLGEEIRECANGLDYALTKIPHDHELRQKVLQLLFNIIEEQMYRENNIGAEEAKRVLLEHVNPVERDKVASWVRALQTAQKKDNGEEYSWIKDFLIDLEKDQLDPEIYLQHYRETNQITKLVDSLLHLGRVKEAVAAAEQQGPITRVLPLTNLFLLYKQDDIAERLVLEAVKQQVNLDLLNWLKDFYLRKNQQEKALEYALNILYISPQFSYYQQVQELAQPLGKWETLREEILSFLKEHNHETFLLEIYLEERDLRQAIEIFNSMTYQTPVTFKNTNRFLLALRLAAAARHHYPLFAIQVYQEIVQDLIEERNRESYRRACDYMKVIQQIFKENRQGKEWNVYIKNVMQTYSRFKALKDEMQQAGLI